MQVIIYDLTNNVRINITAIVADMMEVDSIPEDSAEAIQIGADYAVEHFGHNNVDCGSE